MYSYVNGAAKIIPVAFGWTIELTVMFFEIHFCNTVCVCEWPYLQTTMAIK